MAGPGLNLGIRMVGVNVLVAGLRSLADRDSIDSLTRALAEELEVAVREHAPYDTGDLYHSIEARRGLAGKGWTLEITADHAVPVIARENENRGRNFVRDGMRDVLGDEDNRQKLLDKGMGDIIKARGLS